MVLLDVVVVGLMQCQAVDNLKQASEKSSRKGIFFVFLFGSSDFFCIFTSSNNQTYENTSSHFNPSSRKLWW
jgi:hypothetical protein